MENKRFQWIKGDNYGLVEILLNQDNESLFFESGRKIFKTVLDEYMIELGANEESLIEIEPQFVNPAYSNKFIEQKNPIYETILKSKKKAKFTVRANFEIEIELPPTMTYDVLVDSFYDEKEVDAAYELFFEKLISSDDFKKNHSFKKMFMNWFQKEYKNG